MIFFISKWFQPGTYDNYKSLTHSSMDKLSIISGALFFAADVFAVVSLAMPHWIVSEIGGKWLANDHTLIIFCFVPRRLLQLIPKPTNQQSLSDYFVLVLYCDLITLWHTIALCCQLCYFHSAMSTFMWNVRQEIIVQQKWMLKMAHLIILKHDFTISTSIYWPKRKDLSTNFKNRWKNTRFIMLPVMNKDR